MGVIDGDYFIDIGSKGDCALPAFSLNGHFDRGERRILDLDPAEVDHIRYCHERGLGPLDLEQIEILGDVSLEQAQKDAKGFRKGLVRVEDYFKGSPITAYAGPAGKDADCDYCWGGCPGAMEEAIEIIRTTDPKVDQTMKPLHVLPFSL